MPLTYIQAPTTPSRHPIFPFSTAHQPPSPPETAHLVIYHSCHMLHYYRKSLILGQNLENVVQYLVLVYAFLQTYFPSIIEVYQLQMLNFELNFITLGEL